MAVEVAPIADGANIRNVVSATGLDRDLAGGERLEEFGFGPEGQADLAGNGVPAGHVFDAGPGLPERVPAGVAFEMDAQQPWVHGQLYLSGGTRSGLT